MIYRRSSKEQAWHFCRNCVRWPREDYQERTVEPPVELLCTACIEKNERLQCEIVPQPGAA